MQPRPLLSHSTPLGTQPPPLFFFLQIFHTMCTLIKFKLIRSLQPVSEKSKSLRRYFIDRVKCYISIRLNLEERCVGKSEKTIWSLICFSSEHFLFKIRSATKNSHENRRYSFLLRLVSSSFGREKFISICMYFVYIWMIKTILVRGKYW